MKLLTFLTLLILISATMTGCAVFESIVVVEEPIVFEALTVPGFEVEVESILRIYSPVIDSEGNIEDDTYEVHDDLTALLDILKGLEVDIPEMPASDFNFRVELISFDFVADEAGLENGYDRELPSLVQGLASVEEDGVVRFPEVTFADAGVFTYKISQQIEGSEGDDGEDDGQVFGWALDNSSMMITITVSEDFEVGKLVAEVEKEDFTFENIFTYDISELVYAGVQMRLEERLARICEDFDLAPIESALERYGDGVSIYFENLDTGCVFKHNEEENFFAASVTKAPFALWVYKKAEEGYVCLDMTMYFTQDVLRLRSGIIRHEYELGDAFPLRRILALNLYESDNTATQMLLREFGYREYADFIEKLGGTREYAKDVWNSRITAEEAGFFAREIYNYIESDQEYSDEFRRYLLNNQYPFIVADYPVASKTGWHEYFGAWHDMAIVYAPSPYILTILSSDRTGTDEDHEAYEYISLAFQEFNRVNFEPYIEYFSD